MGNTQAVIRKRRTTAAPLALVQRTEGRHPESAIQHSTGSVSSHTFGSVSRTAPISPPTPDDHKSTRTRSQDTMLFWPENLEENYVFEEVYEFGNNSLGALPYTDPHLQCDLELHTLAIAILTQASSRLPKKRVGHERREHLCALSLENSPSEEKTLELTGRSIVSLTMNIGLYNSLTTLNLTKNGLIRLPEEIGLLTKLKELKLSNNCLKCLPESIGFLENLVELDLGNNELDTLPRSIGKLDRLKALNISQNKFKVIPRNLGNLSRLTVFEAEKNMIEFLPAEMSLLKRLRKINLNGNPLIKEDHAYTKAKSISTISGPQSMLECSARSIIRADGRVLSTLPVSLRMHLLKAEECIFCHGPFIKSYCARVRLLQRQEQTIPFVYYLCSPHWDDERDRLRVMFERPPITTPNSALHMKRSISKTHLIGLPTERHQSIPNLRSGHSRGQVGGTMRLSQLAASPSMPCLPKHFTISVQPSRWRKSSGSLGLLEIERLPLLLDQTSIAVERRWLDVPTEVNPCLDRVQS